MHASHCVVCGVSIMRASWPSGLRVPNHIQRGMCNQCIDEKAALTAEAPLEQDNHCVMCGKPQRWARVCALCVKELEGHAADFDERQSKKLKLFKVTIPSQTLGIRARGPTPYKAKKLTVGEITDYGFIQGREIIVLAESYSRLWDQCLRELGCEAQDVDLRVEEIEGPFKHGYVIAYNQPDGL